MSITITILSIILYLSFIYFVLHFIHQDLILCISTEEFLIYKDPQKL